jgi:hypothetical protein
MLVAVMRFWRLPAKKTAVEYRDEEVSARLG